jgi:hypothetical protein
MTIKYERDGMELTITGSIEELKILNAVMGFDILGHEPISPVTIRSSTGTIFEGLTEIINKLNEYEARAHNKTQANGRAIPRRAVPAGRHQVGEEIGRFKIVRLGKAWRPSPQEKFKHRIGADVEFIQYVYFE